MLRFPDPAPRGLDDEHPRDPRIRGRQLPLQPLACSWHSTRACHPTRLLERSCTCPLTRLDAWLGTAGRRSVWPSRWQVHSDARGWRLGLLQHVSGSHGGHGLRPAGAHQASAGTWPLFLTCFADSPSFFRLLPKRTCRPGSQGLTLTSPGGCDTTSQCMHAAAHSSSAFLRIFRGRGACKTDLHQI